MPIVLMGLVLVYFGLSVFVWRHTLLNTGKHYSLKTEALIVTPALIIHGAVLALPVLQDQVLIMGFGYALSLIVWLMLLIYYMGSYFYSLKGLQLLLYPCAAASLTLAAIFPGKTIGYQISDWPFILHVSASLLAYGLFGIATLLAVLILLLDHSLHKRKFSPLISFLPPLLSLEKLMFQVMWAGFMLLSFSVISGTFFAEVVFGQPLNFSHKTVFGILSWLISAGLLLKRSMTAWRGKNVAVWTIIGFISLMLAYVGSKFVLEILLGR